MRKIYDKINKGSNTVLTFLVGIIAYILYCLIFVKVLQIPGVFIAFISGLIISYLLKKKYPEVKILKSFNRGFFTGNVIMSIAAFAIGVTVFSAVSNLIN